ncbi:MAG: twin-arginine translocase TatA/TatE family subunit [Tepidisphaeraceae bacterium]
MPTPLLAIGFGPLELTLLAGLGLLLFGKRLPDVAKGLGRSVVEFKKGLSGIEDDINTAGTKKTDAGTTPPTTPPAA